MAKTTSNPFTQTIRTPGIIIPSGVTLDVIANTTGVVTPGVLGTSGPQLVATAGTNDSVLKSLIITSNDTADRYVHIWLDRAGTTPLTLLATISIPATSGANTGGNVASVDILGSLMFLGLPTDQTGKPTLPMAAGTNLYVGLVAGLTGFKVLYVTAVLEDY
jgi:hypothetical protein